YLALAVQLGAGLDGIRRKIQPPEPVDKDISQLTVREYRKYRIQELPRDLSEAIAFMKKDEVVRRILGDHVFHHFIAAKEQEWQACLARGRGWEMERYLAA